MYCWNCGKEIDEKAIFCPNCGMKQAGAPEPPKEKQKGFLLPVICAAVCVGALLGMILIMTKDAGSQTPQMQETVAAVPAATEAEQEPETTKAAVQASSEDQVDPYSAELPDLASFLDTEYTQDEWGYTHYVTCLIDDNDDIVQAVLDLLLEPRYQLKLMDKDSDSDGTHYTYEYTGKNGDIDWVYLKKGGQYHVKLTVKPYGSSQKALILYTFPEFYLEDPGKRCSIVQGDEEDDDSDNGGGGGIFDDKCWYCGGDGRCNDCGGSGQVYKWQPGTTYRVQVRCTNCNGGSCRQCGGDGKK